MNWLGFSLIALTLWGVWGLLSKMATQHLPPPTVYLLAISGHLAAVAFLLLRGDLTLPWNPGGMGLAVLAGLCMAFGLLSFMQALARGPAAVVVPFTALYPALTALLSHFVLQEALTPRRLAGIALALVAAWLLSK